MAARLLILTSFDLRAFDPSYTANLALAWGLDERGIDWTTHYPSGPKPELGRYDAVLSWWGVPELPERMAQIPAAGQPYGWVTPPVARYFYDRDVERECARLGIPVINPLLRRSYMKHSYCLERWREHGIPCAAFQAFSDPGEIELDYPLCIRVDGGAHSHRDFFRVDSPAEAERVVERRRHEKRPAFDLAIEFKETRYADGLYRKRRSFVVGDRVLPRQEMLSESWLIKLGSALTDARAVAADREFRRRGEEAEELVARAASVLGPDVVALDYTRLEDGSCLFWEGNPRFVMAGLGNGASSKRFRAAVGRSVEECRRDHLELGVAIADLVLERIEAEPTPA